MNRSLISASLGLLLLAAVATPLAAQQREQSKPAVDLRTMQGRPEGLPLFGSPQKSPLGVGVQSPATITPYGLPERRTVATTPRQQLPRNNDDTTATPRETVLRLTAQRAENGTVRWLEGALGNIQVQDPKHQHGGGLQSASRSALGLLQSYRELLKLRNPQQELTPLSITTDPEGFTHFRFAQTWQNIPVWGRDLYVHATPDGAAYVINGTYEPTPVAAQTTASISGSNAIEATIADLRSKGRWEPLPADAATVLKFDPPTAKLVLFPTADGAMRLAWEVAIYPNLIEHFTYLVDASNGAILNRIPRHCSIVPPAGNAAPPRVSEFVRGLPAGKSPAVQSAQGVAAAGFKNATATDLNGKTQSFRVYQHTDNIHYLLFDLPNFNQAKSQLPDNPAGGAITISAGNNDLTQNVQLSHVTSANNTWGDRSSVSSHANAKVTYDYYKNTHNRNAIDDKDESIVSIIHVTEEGQPMDNAFWNGRVMAYGDGNQAFTPLAGGLDVAGHEMTHGVIEHSANLIYQNQSGALNESFADVFGLMVDRDDFFIGEDITRTQFGVALRDMLNPDNNNVISPQQPHMNQFRQLGLDNDNGGVHINSGIPNRAAALLIQEIGREKVEKIYYRALTNYLTRNSNFIDCRNAVLQAAKDLHGDGAEAAAVRKSFAAVGIGTDDGGSSSGGGNNSGGNNSGNNNVPPAQGTNSVIAFMLDNGTIGLLDVDASSVQLFDNAVARVNRDGNNVDRSQLSTGRNGSRIWFVNTQQQLANVDINTGQVSTFPDLRINANGSGPDIWNASVTPDESFVALVSAYEKDPNLYFFEVATNRLSVVQLKPQTTQSGITDESIQFPDVVSWSPNLQLPKLAFDAFRQLDIAGGTTSFWSMYEIDFSADLIYNLIPAQPGDVSVGNVTYSNTDPDVLAFNVIGDVEDVTLVNFATNTQQGLSIQNFNIQGNPIRDADRPTFSPDDRQICFTTQSQQAFLFYTRSNNQLSFLKLTPEQPVFHARWFTRGESPAAPTFEDSVFVEAVTPNPTKSGGTIRFQVPRAVDAQVTLFDPSGRQALKVFEGTANPGSNEIPFDASPLPAGSYVVQVRASTATKYALLALVK